MINQEQAAAIIRENLIKKLKLLEVDINDKKVNVLVKAILHGCRDIDSIVEIINKILNTIPPYAYVSAITYNTTCINVMFFKRDEDSNYGSPIIAVFQYPKQSDK